MEAKLKFNKVPLSEAHLVGGLNTGLLQVYKFNFLPAEGEWDAKVELAITLEKQGLSQGAYRSLRFRNLAQLEGFTHNLLRAYIFFGKTTGIINPKNFVYKMEMLKRFVDACFRADTESLKNRRAY